MPKPHGGKLINRQLPDPNKEKALETLPNLEKIEVSPAVASDIENIAKGVFSPLEGFMTREVVESVLHHMRLPNDLAWTIPILLDVPKTKAEKLRESEQVALYYNNKPLAIMHLEEKYSLNKEDLAKATFGTNDSAQP